MSSFVTCVIFSVVVVQAWIELFALQRFIRSLLLFLHVFKCLYSVQQRAKVISDNSEEDDPQGVSSAKAKRKQSIMTYVLAYSSTKSTY